MYDILVIGAGPAGLTAAIYGMRYGLTVAVFEEMVYGGQVATTPEVENYPGFEKIAGYEFAMKLYDQTTKLGAKVIMEKVTGVSLTGDVKKVITPNGEYEGKTVIIANGAKRRKLGVPGEEKFTGRGVSYCGTCDGAFFKGKAVAMVGGGNTALEDALFLSNLAEKVYLIHRRDEFRGAEILGERVRKKDNIELILNANVTEIVGEKSVEKIVVDSKGEISQYPVSGVFIAVGTMPENQLFADEVEIDSTGYIVADENCKTNISGVFVAGDTRLKSLRQIVTATSDGATSAFMAANYI